MINSMQQKTTDNADLKPRLSHVKSLQNCDDYFQEIDIELKRVRNLTVSFFSPYLWSVCQIWKDATKKIADVYIILLTKETSHNIAMHRDFLQVISLIRSYPLLICVMNFQGPVNPMPIWYASG